MAFPAYQQSLIPKSAVHDLEINFRIPRRTLIYSVLRLVGPLMSATALRFSAPHGVPALLVP